VHHNPDATNFFTLLDAAADFNFSTGHPAEFSNLVVICDGHVAFDGIGVNYNNGVPQRFSFSVAAWDRAEPADGVDTFNITLTPTEVGAAAGPVTFSGVVSTGILQVSAAAVERHAGRQICSGTRIALIGTPSS
jgi:hypothetical protein